MPAFRKTAQHAALFLAVATAFHAQAEDAPPSSSSTPAVTPAPAPAFKLPPSATVVGAIPWANDYSYLADPARRSGAAWERWSYIPLGDDPSWYMSLGGEIRYNYNDYDHTALGVRPDRNAMLQQRLRAHADMHFGPDLRLFVELGDNREFFYDTPTPPNRNRLDLAQGFIDLGFDVGDGARLTLRPGRFQMPIGDGTLVGLRDGVNVRYTYDGVRAMLTLADGTKVDAFSVRPTTYGDRDTFDDKPDSSRDFSGLYVSRPLGAKRVRNVDAFLYSAGRDVASYQAGSGKERRYSAGARLWTRADGAWDYDVEAVYQWGDFGNGGDISAWGVLAGAGYTLRDARFTPRIGARLNAFSGDRDLGDGRIGTFVPPYPRTPLYTDAGWFNMMNLSSAHLDATFKFAPALAVTVGAATLWRESNEDAIYFGPTSAPLVTVPGNDRHVADTLNVQADWQVNRFFNFHFYYTHAIAGDALEKAGGDTSNFYGLWAQLRF